MLHWHGWKREEITEDAVKQRMKEKRGAIGLCILECKPRTPNQYEREYIADASKTRNSWA